MQAQVAALYEAITETQIASRIYTDTQIARLRAEIPKIQDVIVLSPVDGKMHDLQTVLWDMYDVLRYGGLTAAQYDSLKLTAQVYDDKWLTAYRYDMYGLFDLMWRENTSMMHAPKSGNWLSIPVSVYQVADGVRTKSPTASAYDEAELTAKAFDSAEVTAYAYDWNYNIA